jgi:hypothetical protein
MEPCEALSLHCFPLFFPVWVSAAQRIVFDAFVAFDAFDAFDAMMGLGFIAI